MKRLRWWLKMCYWRWRYPDAETPQERIDRAAELLDDALRRLDPKQKIWDDADYMTAALAILTDGDRARAASVRRFALDNDAEVGLR